MRCRWLWVPAFAGTTGDGGMSLTTETIIQSLASGLLMGLLYGLIAVGLALIFRSDGRGEFRARRISHDRHVCDVLSVRVLCHRSPACSAFSGGGSVRIRSSRLSTHRALRGAGQSQRRHGADFLDLRARDRDARPRAVLLHAGLPQRHSQIMAGRKNCLDCRNLTSPYRNLSGALVSPSWRSLVSISLSGEPISAARSKRPEKMPGAVALVGIDKNQACLHSAGVLARH